MFTICNRLGWDYCVHAFPRLLRCSATLRWHVLLKLMAVCVLVGVANVFRFHTHAVTSLSPPMWRIEYMNHTEPTNHTELTNYSNTKPTVVSTPVVDLNPRNNATVIWHCHMGLPDPNPGGAGIMKQMRTFFGAYIIAVEKNAYLYKGNFSYEYTDNTIAGCNAPMEAMIDIDALPRLRSMLVEEPVGEHIQSPCEPCWKSDFKWTPRRTSINVNARKAFMPSERLRNIVPQSLCPVDSCVCLHSRLEQDFVNFFGRQAGSGKSLAGILKNHAQRVGFGNATILYVAGKQFDEYTSIPTFANVTTKPDYPELRTFERAMIDLQICQNALFHIGTSASIFDQWISEDRLLHSRIPSWDYVGNKGLRQISFPKIKEHLGTLKASHQNKNGPRHSMQ